MDVTLFQKKVFDWYGKNKRQLPWRETTDPYKIMVSEVMLQQTQVDRVIPKYNQFTKAFPTIRDLAAAPLAKVITLWSGLGYNSRAVRLKEAATIITEKCNGKVPQDREQLLSLPCIGPYTADAILSFAFNLPCPCIDTNIRRILLHELKLPESTPKEKLYSIAKELIPKGRSRDWHNALMDYGSEVLTAKKTGIKPLTSQSTFLHSRRWYRGQIMKLLVRERKVTLQELKERFQQEESWLKELLEEMQKEQLIDCTAKAIQLPT